MITKIWYQKRLDFLTWILFPLSIGFCMIVNLRKWLYRSCFKRSTTFSVPIIVVGNVTVGGTGKTPFVIYLVGLLERAGYSPGIISRGYGANPFKGAKLVTRDLTPQEVGDEPFLMARHLMCPIVISSSRTLSAEKMLHDFPGCNVIISDDGLQHYALNRDIEILIVDGNRRFGNGLCLPAGPLRESLSRLTSIDYIICNGKSSFENEITMTIRSGIIISLTDEKKELDLTSLKQRSIHAVAGIGNPERFFNTLRNMGLIVIEHVFPDHHWFKYKEIDFGNDAIVIMTEKDAVKCRSFADNRHWYLPITAELPANFETKFKNHLHRIVVNKED